MTYNRSATHIDWGFLCSYFFLRSAHRLFIASDKRFLPAAVSLPPLFPVLAGAAAVTLLEARRVPIPSNASIA